MTPECQNCGGHVSERFARVMGDADDTVHACPRCDSKGALLAGTAAGIGHRLDQELRKSLSDRASGDNPAKTSSPEGGEKQT